MLETDRSLRQAQIIARCENLLERAKAGEFYSIAYVVIEPNGDFSVNSMCENRLQLAGALSAMLSEVLDPNR